MLIYEKAFAKINLTLSVLGRRADGYHDLASLVVFANLFDEIEIELNTKQRALEIEGEFASALPQSEENLIFKAMDFLGVEARVKLVKNIPVAAGLGGGSADAAAFIRGVVNALKKPKPSYENLFRLGADVPACYFSKTLFMTGAGENIEELNTKPLELFCVLTCPKQAISTAEIFAKWDLENGNKNFPTPKGPLKLNTIQDVFDFYNSNKNDFQSILPSSKHTLELLKKTNANIIAMSGTGPSCFGLYEKELDAQTTAIFIKEKGMWAWQGKLLI